MPKGEQRGNREAKKPKKEKPKTIAVHIAASVHIRPRELSPPRHQYRAEAAACGS